MPEHPVKDVVRGVVARQVSELEEHLERQGRFLCGWQRRALDRLATCCDPGEGFALLRCGDCRGAKVVPFTCAIRTVCTTCGGRTMSARAARWVDTLFPTGVGVRQWVLTVPFGRRFILARRPDLTRALLAIAVRAVFSWYEARCCDQTGRVGKTGSVTVIQRFSSSLSLNVHLHILVVDAACIEEEAGSVGWHRVGPPSTEDGENIVAGIAAGAEALFAEHGFAVDEPWADDAEPDDATVLLDAAAAGRSALGLRAGRRTRRLRPLPERPWRRGPRCAEVDGYNLHANVAVLRRDALERLCRYVNRPAFAKGRLTRRADGLLELSLRRPWANGTTSFLFSELELAQRLVALLPPPRVNQVLYHGVLSARSRLRSRVVPTPPASEPSRGALRKSTDPPRTHRWTRWADLLYRVFGRDGFACPCGGRLVLHAVVMPPATFDVLDDLRRSARGPPSAQPPSLLLPPTHLPPPPQPLL